MLNSESPIMAVQVPPIPGCAAAVRHERRAAPRGVVRQDLQAGRPENARAMVRLVLQERTGGKKLPSEVSAFLNHDWRSMLERVYLEFGVDSAEWIGAVQLVDDLVWLLQRHTDERSLCRLEWLLPDLYRRVSIAFDGSRCGSDGQGTRLAALRQLLDSFAQARQQWQGAEAARR